jgi:hypothetical protein
MSNSNRRGPRALSDILGELFTVRGYGRLRALGELEEVWNSAVGEPHCRQTRLGEVRRGVLTVTVAHPTLLEELAAFRKTELLEALRSGAQATTIHDIRFRVGPIDRAGEAQAEPSPPGSRQTRSPEGLRPGGSPPAGRRRPRRSRTRSDDGGQGARGN